MLRTSSSSRRSTKRVIPTGILGFSVSSRREVVADDPTLSRRGILERLEVTENPRHRKMLKTLVEHDRCEGSCDLDGVMQTFGADPEFNRYGPTGDNGPKGFDAIRAHYFAIFAQGGIRNLIVDYRRVVVDDNTIVLEYRVTRLVPGRLAKASGYNIPHENARYAITANLVGLFPFDDEGRMLGEVSYGSAGINPDDWELVPEEELTAGYLEWERQFACGE
jgi:hypothetical protein